MIPCIPEHIGADRCPSCNEPHTEVSALPDRLLSVTDCAELAKSHRNEMNGIMPLFRIHTEEYYQKVIPALVVVSQQTVRVLWCDPETEDGWVIIHEETDVEYPYELGTEIGEALRESTYREKSIKGHEVVYPDNELTDAVESRETAEDSMTTPA